MPRFQKTKRKSYTLNRRLGRYRRLTRRPRRLVGKLLRQARQEAKLNQSEAGALLGQDQTFVSKIECGLRQVEFVEVEQLALIYRKPLAFFATVGRLKTRSSTAG
jgi:hypothetical protein